MRRIEKFVTSDGRSPFADWVSKLDHLVQGRIYAFVDRVALGAAKRNVKALGDGVFEIRIDTGPGYRVYISARL
jgi:putative addiction module killer protein